jgi:hypothetical protein
MNKEWGGRKFGTSGPGRMNGIEQCSEFENSDSRTKILELESDKTSDSTRLERFRIPFVNES